MQEPNRNIRRKGAYRESDSYDEGNKEGIEQTDGSFSNSEFQFDHQVFGIPRRNIHFERYEDDEFSNDFDPTYEKEYGIHYPRHESHFGKGPKGYRRSPERIKDDACEILARDFELDASQISVDIEDNVLVLKGEVTSRREKRRAEWLLENLPGIEDIRNLITIKKSNLDGWIPGLGSIEDEV